MADIYGSHFEIGGISSRAYDLVIANIDTSRMTQMRGREDSITIFSKSTNKRYIIGDDRANSPVSFEIEIVTKDGSCIRLDQKREIEKWLFFSRYRRLYFDIQDDENGEMYEYVDGNLCRHYLNCRFVNPEKVEAANGIIGYKVTLEADSNMFWQDEITRSFSISNTSDTSTAQLTVPLDTDMQEYVYPNVLIQTGAIGGDIVITNHLDSDTRITKFDSLPPNTTIEMRGDIRYIDPSYYDYFTDRNFIRLLDGQNLFTVVGDVISISFEYAARRAM